MSASYTIDDVTLSTRFFIYDGYGSMAEYIALGMARTGITVNIDAIIFDPRGYSAELHRLHAASHVRPESPMLYFHWPQELKNRLEHPYLFVYTMWESSALPRHWPERLNQAQAVIVPTRFVRDVLQASGVDVPLYVVPLGVDPDIYPHIERPKRDTLTTLMVIKMMERKHWAQGVNAWYDAFGDDPKARLIIKTHGAMLPVDVFSDSRIAFVNTHELTRGIAHWYEKADCLLALGNEGFGLPLIEAMATGLPVIALNTEGQGDVCEDAKGLVLEVDSTRKIPYVTPEFGTVGQITVPDEAQVSAHLQWIANNRAQARTLGQAASEWVHRHRSAWDIGPRLLDIIDTQMQLG